MKESRIEAVDHVHLEAHPAVEEDLLWFYGEVAELPRWDWPEGETAGICFRSERIELRIRLVDHPRIDPIPCRLTVRVFSLERSCELMEERSLPYQVLSGLSFTDRRVEVCDPAGHRVALRQYWPYAPL